MDEIFVKKEKMLEKRYVDMLERIRKYFKDIEHGKIKEVTGKELDNMLKDTDDYLKRIRKLFDQIETKKMKEGLKETHDNIVTIARDALMTEGIKDVSEESLLELFKSKLVNTGKITQKTYRKLKELLESTKNSKTSKTEIENINQDGREFIRTVIEFIQRKRGFEIERAKIRVKYGDKFGEIIMLEDWAFAIIDLDVKEKEIKKASINKDGSLGTLKDSSLEEMEQHISKVKSFRKTFIKEPVFENLKEIFGKNVEILVNN